MDIDDLMDELESEEEYNPEVTALTKRSDADVLRDWRRGCHIVQASEDEFADGRKIVIVDNDDGFAEYAIMDNTGRVVSSLDSFMDEHDEHLGGVRD
jgi:hypothetical protein